MGRLTDRWTGTKYPRKDVAPLPALEVRAALLAVNGSDVRFVVREGTPKPRTEAGTFRRVSPRGRGQASVTSSARPTIGGRSRPRETLRTLRQALSLDGVLSQEARETYARTH